MLDIHIAEVNNGYIVNIVKHEEKQPSIPGGGMDFGKLMEQGMKVAMKMQNEDNVLSDIHEKNQNPEIQKYLGTSVFLKFEEAAAFIKLAKEELSS